MLRPLILCIDYDKITQYVRQLLLEASGYNTENASFGDGSVQAVRCLRPDAVILDGGENESAARALAVEIRHAHCDIPMVVMISRAVHVARDGRPYVTVNRLDGPASLLDALDRELQRQTARHPELESPYFAVVDASRNYLEASEQFCELVGYRRRELLMMKVDDLTAPATANVARQFEEYLQTGRQRGQYVLRKKDGGLVAIEFVASILGDGCMAASFKPLSVDASQVQSSYSTSPK